MHHLLLHSKTPKIPHNALPDICNSGIFPSDTTRFLLHPYTDSFTRRPGFMLSVMSGEFRLCNVTTSEDVALSIQKIFSRLHADSYTLITNESTLVEIQKLTSPNGSSKTEIHFNHAGVNIIVPVYGIESDESALFGMTVTSTTQIYKFVTAAHSVPFNLNIHMRSPTIHLFNTITVSDDPELKKYDTVMEHLNTLSIKATRHDFREIYAMTLR
jgi:hypothetical protein